MEPRTAPTPSAGNRHDGGRRGGGGEQRFQLFCGLWLLFGASVVNVATLHQYAKMREKPSSEPRSKVGRWLKESFRSYRSRRLVPSTPGDDAWWLGRMDPSLEHPYKGARHPNGTTHLLVDPSTSRLAKVNITDSTSSDAVCPSSSEKAGIEGEGGHEVLEKVRGGMLNTKQKRIGVKHQRRSRILCLVYSVHFPLNKTGTNAHVAEHANLRATAETWGRNCDGFIGASNATNHSIGAVDLLHAGPEEYANMWQKVRSMWAYATNYLSDYDFFHIIGDDAYVLVDNLRAYLDGDEVLRLEQGYLDEISRHDDFLNNTQKWKDVRPRPLFLGLPIYRRQRPKFANGTFDPNGVMYKMTYPAGGSGYTLNRAALQLLRDKGLDQIHADIVDSREDVLLGGLFANLGVYVSNTIDARHGGRYIGSAEDAYRRKTTDPGPAEPKRMKNRYKMYHANGLEGVSPGAFSFHLKDDNGWLARANQTLADLMRRYHAIVYNLCK